MYELNISPHIFLFCPHIYYLTYCNDLKRHIYIKILLFVFFLQSKKIKKGFINNFQKILFKKTTI
ncbi:MAG: hypothetical protein CVU04_04570 [Bacteroidetes bacterium HGW-Bacteroidetes-20]|nr:MAG: hypothetical protein CVU04_04570 [Bacteroidetes bacterium HGW-Bacteroidetes-20]